MKRGRKGNVGCLFLAALGISVCMFWTLTEPAWAMGEPLNVLEEAGVSNVCNVAGIQNDGTVAR